MTISHEDLQREIAELREERRRGLELSNFQKVLVGLFTTGCAWVAYSTAQLTVSMAVVQATLAEAVVDRYRAGDAARDHATINTRVDGLDRRVVALEGRR